MKVWVLTSEVNDYDQHGDYFLAVFKNKPSKGVFIRFRKRQECCGSSPQQRGWSYGMGR